MSAKIRVTHGLMCAMGSTFVPDIHMVQIRTERNVTVDFDENRMSPSCERKNPIVSDRSM